LWTCSPTNGTCVPAPPGGGQPKDQCQKACVPHNDTPVNLIGDYRGLEISKGYIKGEWDASFTTDAVTIWNPSGAVWAKGLVQTFLGQLWINEGAKGIRKGLTAQITTPEVLVLTLGLGAPGANIPPTLDSAMENDTVFVLMRCLNAAICKFNVGQIFDLISAQVPLPRVKRQVIDPCMQYPTCQICVESPNYCGWCSVDVI